ncbi:P-loop containing nucleoside triphosphate hydrolase protein, partial [Geopyxis carbonaria]
LVFCSSKEMCERLADATKGYVYHAEYPGRDDNLSDWQKRVSPFRRVMACTPALGMGTDLKFVSLVVHLDYPFSMTDYIQESGRCARDG